MAMVNDLEAGLVPRSEFAQRQWFCASADAMWYYHRPGRPAARSVKPDLYSLIDPHLRDLCLVLHRAGMGTLPSCEGHFHDGSYFRAVWDELQKQRDAIRGRGLPLSDSESGDRLIFAKPSYQLPWPSFQAFHEDLSRTQPGGYLGVALKPQDWPIARELAAHPLSEARATTSLQRPWTDTWIAAVYVDANSPEDVQRQWSIVYRYFQKLLRKRQISATVFPPLA